MAPDGLDGSTNDADITWHRLVFVPDAASRTMWIEVSDAKDDTPSVLKRLASPLPNAERQR
ncbi:MAG: hypothetical protein AAF493_12835 [Pseudomonadota bacterium]